MNYQKFPKKYRATLFSLPLIVLLYHLILPFPVHPLTEAWQVYSTYTTQETHRSNYASTEIVRRNFYVNYSTQNYINVNVISRINRNCTREINYANILRFQNTISSKGKVLIKSIHRKSFALPHHTQISYSSHKIHPQQCQLIFMYIQSVKSIYV